VTHAPAYQLNDGRDLPHQGFQVFKTLMEKYKPKYFLHGHVHLSYGRGHKRYDKYQDTHVINAYERCVFEFEDENPREHVR
ncbi:MAG: metallophosphoesterase, partial [Lachnospiraceae bacterium]|nr:metallophosphoesterase [Lachnospiraceae bacterium]